MHWEPIEETSNGILYSEMLNEYFIDEKDKRSPVEIRAVIDHHMAIIHSAMEADAELQRMEDFEMNSPEYINSSSGRWAVITENTLTNEFVKFQKQQQEPLADN
ncbi:uncharacterized protein LOC124327557 [Daphnia pulicaria]|uniref:uncharacterized protein LOC124327487 n=1 Tax=Daphnia pulicaria TaxID=35523 RepID=UPI001EECE499|nr:uncharacterized protein LOC124327487 [Daphnia pulicaria]XP_046642471.1 uncharacterized protein LOC124327557 [Daphnia pulicaria]